MIDLAIGIGIPVLQMVLRTCHITKHDLSSYVPPLEYIPQGHRFNIYEDFGCFPWTYNTPVAVVLVYIWPVVIGCVSAVYSGTFFRHFLHFPLMTCGLLS